MEMPKVIRARAYQNATIGGMRVKIVKLPVGADADLFGPSNFRVGEIRDVGPRMAELLLACGSAEPYDGPDQNATAADNPPRHKRR